VTADPESIFDSEDDWQEALEGLATELEEVELGGPESCAPDSFEPESNDPLGDLTASIDAAIAAGPEGLAEPAAPEPTIQRQSRLVFSVAGERFSAPLDRVVRLDRLDRLTPVPNTPAFVLGVTNVRGEIVTALDLRQLLGLRGERRPVDARLVQLRAAGGGMTAGVVVDALHGIRELAEGEDGAPHPLDVDALFDSAPIQALLRGGGRTKAA
jgi:purine-binding chemotaxis protein CheW